MSRHGIRHVPVTDGDDPGSRVVGILSERDLFALQRLSLKQVSTAIRAAPDIGTLRMAWRRTSAASRATCSARACGAASSPS